jgi:signal transduction histidine kinase
MVRDVARLERLVSGLRDVARVEGQIEADVTEPIDLGALVSDLAAAADATAPEGRHVRLNRSSSPLRVIASRERLAQVFENLLANAVSFTPPGSTVAVTVAENNGCARTPACVAPRRPPAAAPGRGRRDPRTPHPRRPDRRPASCPLSSDY